MLSLADLRVMAQARAARSDAEFSRDWRAGVPIHEMAARYRITQYAVNARAASMRLPPRWRGMRRDQAGLTPSELVAYKRIRSAGYPAPQAREMLLAQREQGAH